MQNQDWKLLNVPYSGEIEEVLRQQHQAVQFIAMVGKYLIPQEEDDSNTNMQYLPESGLLAGNILSNGLRLALDLHQMSLCFRDSIGKCSHKIPLIGKTKNQVFEELKKTLGQLEMDVSTFKKELHFEIPVHSLDAGAKFSANSLAAVEENIKHRHNTELIFRNIASLYQEAYPVRVWPHHFDTGTIIPVDVNEKGEMNKSIGLGWAIPDGMIKEPYYYLSFWSENQTPETKTLPGLSAGQWMLPDWNGAVLRHSEVQKQDSAQKQFDLVLSFYESGVENLISFLNSTKD